MTSFKNNLLAALFSSAGLIALNGQADEAPVFYISQNLSGSIAVQVYHQDEPVSGATVQIDGSGSRSLQEKETNQYGRVRFSRITGPNPVKIIAKTPEGRSSSRLIYLYRGGDL